MAIEFCCPGCAALLRVADEASGRLIRCGQCDSTLRVPTAPTAHTPPAPADAPLELPTSDWSPDRGMPRVRVRRAPDPARRRHRPRPELPAPFPVVKVVLGVGLLFGL